MYVYMNMKVLISSEALVFFIRYRAMYSDYNLSLNQVFRFINTSLVGLRLNLLFLSEFHKIRESEYMSILIRK